MIDTTYVVQESYSWTMVAWVRFPAYSFHDFILSDHESDERPRAIFAAPRPRRGRYFLPPRDPSDPASLPTLLAGASFGARAHAAGSYEALGRAMRQRLGRRRERLGPG